MPPNYFVVWSPDDRHYVATCLDMPSVSYTAKDEVEALEGLKRLIREVVVVGRKGSI